jgi:hypothetical protein
MVCQIERGRILPSEDTLRGFALRLGMDAEQLLAAWAPWRSRQALREKLWSAAVQGDADVLRLQGRGLVRVLSPFEALVYQGLGEALGGEWFAADTCLDEAWMNPPPDPNLCRRGPVRRSSVTGGTDELAYAGAWTALDQARALAADAMARVAICRGIGRLEAARYWEQRLQARMAAVRDRMSQKRS